MRQLSFAATCLTVALTGTAGATMYQPPDDFTFRQWAVIETTDACLDAVGIRPVCGQSSTGGIPLLTESHSFTTAQGTFTHAISGSASSNANTMRSFMSLTAGAPFGTPTTSGTVRNSMFDTYTLFDPTMSIGAPLTAILSFTADGRVGRNQPFSFGGVTIEVGTFDPTTFQDPRCPPESPYCTYNESARVTPFAGGATTGFGYPLSFGGAAVPEAFEISLNLAFNVLNGVAYDVAYGLNIDGINLFADASSTAHIDWDIPDGATLTSVLGWTDPDAAPVVDPAQDVPEPATLVLLGLAIGGLGWVRRQRRVA